MSGTYEFEIVIRVNAKTRDAAVRFVESLENSFLTVFEDEPMPGVLAAETYRPVLLVPIDDLQGGTT